MNYILIASPDEGKYPRFRMRWSDLYIENRTIKSLLNKGIIKCTHILIDNTIEEEIDDTIRMQIILGVLNNYTLIYTLCK